MTDLDALYPAPADDPEALRRIRARVLAGTAARKPRQTMLTAAAAAVLAIAVAAAVALRGPEPMAQVAQTLTAAADAQIRFADTPVPPGRYRYIATHAVNMSISERAAVLVGRRYETWVPADPAGDWFRARAETGERTPVYGTDDQEPSAPERHTGRCGLPAADWCTGAGNWQQPTARFVAGLPRDPQALYDLLRAETDGKGRHPDQEVLVHAADALRSGLLPADLRAALYRALALLPDLRITERRATLDGRTGTALGVAAAGERQDIVIDPVSGAFIGERTRFTEDVDGIPAGTLFGSSTVTYAVVDRPWQRP